MGNEMPPFGPRLEIEDIGEELGRGPFVLRRDDRVVEFDAHLLLPSISHITPLRQLPAARPPGRARPPRPAASRAPGSRDASALHRPLPDLPPLPDPPSPIPRPLRPP